MVEPVETSEIFKQKGNEQFKTGKYAEALESYTSAISNSTDLKFNAICYSNRSFCHIKLESYGSALEDA